MTKIEKRSDKDIAKAILRAFGEEMQVHSNLGAIVLWLARESRTTQKIVLDQLRGPPKLGAPKNPIDDEEWLQGVESWANMLAVTRGQGSKKLTDLAVIRHWLETTETRYGRDPNVPFNANRNSGKAEILRIRDAIVRARRNRKKAGIKG